MRSGVAPIANARSGAAACARIDQASSSRPRIQPLEGVPLEAALREQHHRVRNLLCNIQAIASISARSAKSIDRFVASLNERIVALGSVQELIGCGAFSTGLRELVQSQLEDAGRAGSVDIDGPDVEIPACFAVQLGMAIFELTANAAEFGSLSSPGGTLTVRWRVEHDGNGECVRIEWLERGGPPAAEPSRNGFGMDLLDRLLGDRFRVERSFDPEGFSAVIEVTMSEV